MKNKNEIKISLHKIEPTSSDGDLTGINKLASQALNFNMSVSPGEKGDWDILDFSPGKHKNKWKFIYNSLFNKESSKNERMN